MSAPRSTAVTVTAPAVGLRCDAGPRMGVGHLVRSVALAEELLERHHRVVLLGEIDGPDWWHRQLRDRGIERIDPAAAPRDLVAQVRELGLDLVHLDGYHLSPALGRALRTAGTAVSTSCDGRFGLEQSADLHHDQNLGATAPAAADPAERWLVGPRYVLLRDLIRRRVGRGSAATPATPRVLVVFGGSDPYGGAAVVLDLLVATGLPMHVTVPTARADLAEQAATIAAASGRRIEVVEPVDDLATAAVACDAVISAAGSTVWELLCLGVPAGLVCVTDNQRLGYRAVVAEQVAAGLGELTALREGRGRDAATAALTTLLTDAGQRSAWRERGRAVVDGDGRVRVADAMTELVSGSADDTRGAGHDPW